MPTLKEKLREKLKEIETIAPESEFSIESEKTVNPKPKGEKVYGEYQEFNKKCLGKVNPNNPDSISLIEGIEGREIPSVNERLALCGGLWKKYRSNEDPLKVLDQKYEAEKSIRGEEASE